MGPDSDEMAVVGSHAARVLRLQGIAFILDL